MRLSVTRVAFAIALVAPLSMASARGESRGDLTEEAIFGTPESFRIQSVRLRFTHIDQDGRGYQSQAQRRSIRDPGRERVTIEQPQLEVLATQGKFTHRFWAPVDIVTAASPDATDIISTASRVQEAGSIEVNSRYRANAKSELGFRAAFHIEENFRSWLLGLSGARSFAEDNTTVSFGVNQVVDWLDRYNFRGERDGRSYRSTTNVNLAVVQLLSPTTVASVSYGGTMQLGELSNTWNAIPLENGELTTEKLPHLRHRHALMGRLAQAVPQIGMVVKLSYRFYVDSWAVRAHTVDAEIYQRITRHAWLRFDYRVHRQNSVSFWTTRALRDFEFGTADSDLAAFVAQTWGGAVAIDVPARRVRELHLDFGYDRYQRTNGLWANLYTCALGLRF